MVCHSCYQLTLAHTVLVFYLLSLLAKSSSLLAPFDCNAYSCLINLCTSVDSCDTLSSIYLTAFLSHSFWLIWEAIIAFVSGLNNAYKESLMIVWHLSSGSFRRCFLVVQALVFSNLLEQDELSEFEADSTPSSLSSKSFRLSSQLVSQFVSDWSLSTVTNLFPAWHFCCCNFCWYC